jgi:imidazoleglycerol phosphate synthase cyclase subunit
VLRRRIIVCLDVRGGRTVKGVRFQGLRDAGDPVELAARYARDGADELCLLDVSATLEERRTTVETVAAVRAVLDVPMTVGGGIRSVDDAARLLDAGADKVGVNTAALDDPALLSALAARFGRQCVVVSVDAARRLQDDGDGDGWQVVTHAGTRRRELDAIAWAREAGERGAGEVLLTSWDRDGTRSGYDVPLTAAVAAAVEVPVIASGGGAGPEHMAEVLAAGAEAALAAGIFHDGVMTVADVKRRLAAMGVHVRPANNATIPNPTPGPSPGPTPNATTAETAP